MLVEQKSSPPTTIRQKWSAWNSSISAFCSTDRALSWFDVVSARAASPAYFAITTAAIVFSAVMISGYAVLDEIVIYILLAAFLPSLLRSAPLDMSALESVHRALYIAFCVYFAAQAIRGAIVLDIRIIRFVIMFFALGLMAWRLVPSNDFDRTVVARLICWSVSVYFLGYIAAGLIAENLLDMSRFALQGFVWSGTSVAVFPALLSYPAMAQIARSASSGSDRTVLCLTFATTLLAGFYYESRSVWLSLIVFIVLAAPLLGAARAIAMAAIYLLFVVGFPWNHEKLLTPSQFVRDVAAIVQPKDDGVGAVLELKTVRFGLAVFGGFLPGPIRERVAETAVVQRAIGDAAASRSAFADPAGLGTQDIDRKVALIGAMRFMLDDGITRVLFGTGYYTHRVVLIPEFHEVAREFGWSLPRSYDTAVRTATLSAAVVDTGLIGGALWLSLFGCAGLQLVRSSKAMAAVGLATFGFILMSYLVSMNLDMIVMYLALMPRGPILAFYPSCSRKPNSWHQGLENVSRHDVRTSS
ncbi:hypothetical protein [Bradyrhizobium sp. WSM471]|uniref:hypothetical protein n=1 Tax=Bradyrhizobium sp. WSM471 TaxID=319017 RepID=UPI0018DED572|nr:MULTISPECIES: hypothetical protein [Bradyrhizobium]UFW39765.1 hypothetical protein BcanWSM471_26590 [Bradyrhizobium canariense]